MTKKDRNKMAMFLTVLLWLKERIDELSTLPNFQAVYDKFKAYTKEISKLDSKNVPDTKGLSKDKRKVRKLLAKITYETIVMLKAYAIHIEDIILLNSVSFNKTQLYYVSDQVLQSRAAHISQVAKDIGDKALNYGLSEEKKAALTEAEEAFLARVSAPRKGNVDKQDAGSHVHNKVRETNNFLKNKVDSLMEVKGIEKPEMYIQYNAARVIVDR